MFKINNKNTRTTSMTLWTCMIKIYFANTGATNIKKIRWILKSKVTLSQQGICSPDLVKK